MKLAATFGIALAAMAIAVGEETALPEKVPASQILRGVSATPWLGLTVGRLDDAVRAHVPDLPQGIGFVVTEVDAGGPAEKAGVKPYDVFWKLGDQWIANEAQLLTLLRLKKAGEEVKLGLYRTGQSLTLPVVLARAPEDRGLGLVPAQPAVAQPDMPMKVLKPSEGSAEISDADGKAVLTLVNGQPSVKITSSKGMVIYEGPVNDLNAVSQVPESWQARVGALERALAHAMTGARPARVRVLPTPADVEK